MFGVVVLVGRRVAGPVAQLGGRSDRNPPAAADRGPGPPPAGGGARRRGRALAAAVHHDRRRLEAVQPAHRAGDGRHHPSRCHRDPAGGGGRGAGVGARRVRARAVRAAGHAGLARAGEGGVGGARGRRHRRDRRARRQRREIAHQVKQQYEAFVHLSPSGRWESPVLGRGNRYDYWRVALDEFSSEPFHGVGAGGYDPGYYLHRRTTEAIQQPHSLELQTLAELGIVGGLLLLAFLAAVAPGSSVRCGAPPRAGSRARSRSRPAVRSPAGWCRRASTGWS